MDIRMHKFSDKVPEPTLRRLPWYLSNVKLMKEQGETYVSSTKYPSRSMWMLPK